MSDLHPQFPIDFQVGLIKKIGVPFSDIAPSIHISNSARLKAKALLSKNEIKDLDRYCVIHPGTKNKYDQWQFKKFAHLVEVIPKKYGIKVVLACGPGEESQVESVVKFVTNGQKKYIQTGLQELGGITQGALFALCHNGGYMHFASALGTPVIALFGVVHPRVWKPLGEKDQVIYKSIECSPCGEHTRKKECYEGDAECKRVIEVGDVIEAIEKFLNS